MTLPFKFDYGAEISSEIFLSFISSWLFFVPVGLNNTANESKSTKMQTIIRQFWYAKDTFSV